MAGLIDALVIVVIVAAVFIFVISALPSLPDGCFYYCLASTCCKDYSEITYKSTPCMYLCVFISAKGVTSCVAKCYINMKYDSLLLRIKHGKQTTEIR